MAYEAALAARVRRAIGARRRVSEKAMFGGLAFLLDGRMFCGVTGGDLMVRVGRERHEDALAGRHVRPMDFTGRPMKGYVFVGAAGVRTVGDVKRWVERGILEVESLDEKAGSRSRGPAARSGPRTGR